MRRRDGFSLIEILVAVLVTGVVAAIAVPVYAGQRARAKDAAPREAVVTALLAARSFYAIHEQYTGLSSQLTTIEPTLTLGGSEMWSNGPDPEAYRPGGSLVNPRKIRMYVYPGGQCVSLAAVGLGRTAYAIIDCRAPLDYLYGGTTNVHFEPGTYYGDSKSQYGVSSADNEATFEQDTDGFDND